MAPCFYFTIKPLSEFGVRGRFFVLIRLLKLPGLCKDGWREAAEDGGAAVESEKGQGRIGGRFG